MKAAVYIKTESGKTLQIQDLPAPIPKSDEVLIRVRAASVNPIDWRLKKRRPGMDVAGEVEAVGDKVSQFNPGDAVFGTCKAAFAQYACASQHSLFVKPDSLTFEDAASIPIAGLTALQGLRDKGRLRAGQKVLINGASGGVGTFAVQIAKSVGAEITGVCSTNNVELVRALGADQVIDYTREDFSTTGQRYDVILDNVGNRSLSAFRRVLSPKGRCVMAGAPKTMLAVLTRILKAFAWSRISRRKFVFFIAKINPDDLSTLVELTRSGALKVVIDRRYPLSQTADAVAYVEQGHARAKVVITME